jgi:hypothetical protein
LDVRDEALRRIRFHELREERGRLVEVEREIVRPDLSDPPLAAPQRDRQVWAGATDQGQSRPSRQGVQHARQDDSRTSSGHHVHVVHDQCHGTVDGLQRALELREHPA